MIDELDERRADSSILVNVVLLGQSRWKTEFHINDR